jgi:hypothetical protein
MSANKNENMMTKYIYSKVQNNVPYMKYLRESVDKQEMIRY